MLTRPARRFPFSGATSSSWSATERTPRAQQYRRTSIRAALRRRRRHRAGCRTSARARPRRDQYLASQGAPRASIGVIVIEADDTVNAWCMPGAGGRLHGHPARGPGRHGLAVIMAHEIAHAVGPRHGAERMSQPWSSRWARALRPPRGEARRTRDLFLQSAGGDQCGRRAALQPQHEMARPTASASSSWPWGLRPRAPCPMGAHERLWRPRARRSFSPRPRPRQPHRRHPADIPEACSITGSPERGLPSPRDFWPSPLRCAPGVCRGGEPPSVVYTLEEAVRPPRRETSSHGADVGSPCPPPWRAPPRPSCGDAGREVASEPWRTAC
jgi:hypothetical protein